MEVEKYIKSLGCSKEDEEFITMMIPNILFGSESDINIEFSDIQMVMNNRKIVMQSRVKESGEHAALKAIEQILQSVKDSKIALKEVSSSLIHFKMHPDMPVIEIFTAMEKISTSVNKDADIVFGTTCDSSLDMDYVEVSVLLLQ